MGIAVEITLGAMLGYLLGSLPSGYWLALAIGGIDIRQYGSGSTGATNILRTLGKGPAATVLMLDLLKGMAAIWLTQRLLPGNDWTVVGAACLAVLGHSKSIWIGWKGGKSAAISLGILLAMHWPVAIATLGTWLAVLALTRIVSLSSVMGAMLTPLWMYLGQQSLAYIAFGVVGGAYVVIRHRSNIERLLAGVEPQIGQKLTVPMAPPRVNQPFLGLRSRRLSRRE